MFILIVFGVTGLALSLIGKNIFDTKKAQAQKVNSVNTKKKSDKNLGVVSDFSAKAEDAKAESQETLTNTPPDTNVNTNSVLPENSQYPLHKNISTTYFWAGEEAGKDNKNISNLPSAWDDDWTKHFGGIDDPKKRNGFFPAGFTPKENPFYFALPYNDFDDNGDHKKNAITLAGWVAGKKWGADESMCKNQWIKITNNGKTAYAQWEDVGPFGEDDSAYVFGNIAPKSKTNETAGLDVSPAVHDFLALGDIDKVDWQFIDETQVPDGPWKKVVTTSQVYWK